MHLFGNIKNIKYYLDVKHKNMQTLLFNTTTKEVKLYEGEKQSSKLLDLVTQVPTVRIVESGYYEVMKKIDGGEKNIPVLRVPISNTNMFIEK